MTVLLHDPAVMLSDGKFAALEQYIPLKFEVQIPNLTQDTETNCKIQATMNNVHED